MRRGRALVEALVLTPSGKPAVRLACAEGWLTAPGQVMLACQPGGDEPLRRTLFPTQWSDHGFTALLPDEAHWLPGEQLDLLGPVGRGFDPPRGARRWLFAAFGDSFDLLRPLMELGLQRGASLAAWTEAGAPSLPPEIETLPELGAAIGWADFAALSLTPAALRMLGRGHLRSVALGSLPTAQALVIQPLACGLGVCEACALPSPRGHLHVCTDGPVFALRDLLG